MTEAEELEAAIKAAIAEMNRPDGQRFSWLDQAKFEAEALAWWRERQGST